MACCGVLVWCECDGVVELWYSSGGGGVVVMWCVMQVCYGVEEFWVRGGC